MTTIARIVVPLIILFAALLGFRLLSKLAKEPEKKDVRRIVPELPVLLVSPEDHSPEVRSFGTVRPSFETVLTAQVPGRIVEVSPDFRLGKRVSEGDLLVEIDPTDYQAALSAQQASASLAERSYAEEKIRAEQAAADWRASGRKLSDASDFVLRKPQLAASEANISSARAAVRKAEADLARTQIRAPFDLIVTRRLASPGNLANAQSELGTLVATESVEVPLSLTTSEAARVKLPYATGEGAALTLTSPTAPGLRWEARFVRLSPQVTRDQVLTVIAEVKDPFKEGARLPIGTFVNAEIVASVIEDSYRVPESALIDDSYVWIVTEENRLKKVEAVRLHGQQGRVWLRIEDSGLSAPLKIVTRVLATFTEGSEVKALEQEAREKAD